MKRRIDSSNSGAESIPVSVIGDGGWGTTIAIHLANKGYSVNQWGPFEPYLEEMKRSRENRKFLPGFKIPERVRLDYKIERVAADGEILFLAAPSVYFRQTLKRLKAAQTAVLKQKIFVILSKGIEAGSCGLLSEILSEELGIDEPVVVSGPCISREVAQETPTAVVAASARKASRERVREVLTTPFFTVLESNDIIGVQLGGSIKNVLAIAAGILDGLGYGSNTKSVLLSRGMAEMARLGKKLGARPRTFLGLSGLGDLATTAFSIHSRNHLCGTELGRGVPLKEILSRSEMVVEGVETAKAVVRLAKKHKVRMPISEAVHGVLFEKHSPRSVMDAVMLQAIVNESD